MKPVWEGRWSGVGWGLVSLRLPQMWDRGPQDGSDSGTENLAYVTLPGSILSAFIHFRLTSSSLIP